MKTSEEIDSLEIGLVAHLLRFTVRADSTIRFAEFKGSALRGALAGALRRNHCPEWQSARPDPVHRQLCPVCRLLAWEHTDIDGGDIRRPYALTPPLDLQTTYAAGEEFDFGLTIFGDPQSLLPYLVLGVAAMGNDGIGRRDRNGEQGRFTVRAVDAVNPLTDKQFSLYGKEDRALRPTTLPVTHHHVVTAAQSLLPQLAAKDGNLSVRFHTPLRLTQGEHLTKSPEFFPLAKAVVLRMLDLCTQHAGERPELVLRRDIYPLLDQVKLVEDGTRWWDLTGYSGRLGRAQRLGGLVGHAVYRAEDWHALLPWMIWGQIIQAGKNTVKGCGLYSLHV